MKSATSKIILLSLLMAAKLARASLLPCSFGNKQDCCNQRSSVCGWYTATGRSPGVCLSVSPPDIANACPAGVGAVNHPYVTLHGGASSKAQASKAKIKEERAALKQLVNAKSAEDFTRKSAVLSGVKFKANAPIVDQLSDKARALGIELKRIKTSDNTYKLEVITEKAADSR